MGIATRRSARRARARIDADLPQPGFRRRLSSLGLQFHPERVAARFEHCLLGNASELATVGMGPATLRRDIVLYGEDLTNQASGW